LDKNHKIQKNIICITTEIYKLKASENIPTNVKNELIDISISNKSIYNIDYRNIID
jgi:hypothetical protein